MPEGGRNGMVAWRHLSLAHIPLCCGKGTPPSAAAKEEEEEIKPCLLRPMRSTADSRRNFSFHSSHGLAPLSRFPRKRLLRNTEIPYESSRLLSRITKGIFYSERQRSRARILVKWPDLLRKRFFCLPNVSGTTGRREGIGFPIIFSNFI